MKLAHRMALVVETYEGREFDKFVELVTAKAKAHAERGKRSFYLHGNDVPDHGILKRCTSWLDEEGFKHCVTHCPRDGSSMQVSFPITG